MPTTPVIFGDYATQQHIRKSLKFRGVAEAIAKLSKDRSTQVGAVALGLDYEVLGVAYNGFPRGINDDVDARHERPLKYSYTSHAEENLIAAAARNGVSLKGCTVLVTSLFPCTTCSRLMIQAGIACILAPRVDNPRWAEEAKVAMEMLSEAGVRVHYYEL
jgi:dCMP deaminase